MIDQHNQHRDSALMVALATGHFVHLTLASGAVRQGWLHLHTGVLWCCTHRIRGECDAFLLKYVTLTGDEPTSGILDVEEVIRIDQAITRSGYYVPLWHHPEYANKHHVIDRHDLQCCCEEEHETGGE
jgi:hypothetical protein